MAHTRADAAPLTAALWIDGVPRARVETEPAFRTLIPSSCSGSRGLKPPAAFHAGSAKSVRPALLLLGASPADVRSPGGAFQGDLTRMCTFMVGREASTRVYPGIGIPEQHHPPSHHRKRSGHLRKVAKINCLHAGQFAWFLKRLAAISEGNGSLLDRSMIVYASAISDGNEHLHVDLPVLPAGPNGGSHVVCPPRTT
ncbi:MAG TPA: DUF1552 domain-containing protein [Candidatus Sulfopaludibacter sp.]|nr:DUF1552 domain-containing protein [Candidatus Sulfopaludibacter sp.]